MTITAFGGGTRVAVRICASNARSALYGPLPQHPTAWVAQGASPQGLNHWA
eukprot:CAMPEP_0172642656 /NCGR_PEP_ID=MMETSP1068-20121228/233181_1 /TAXON_ID=35684 /ORGANISM="Pseudopedinella elastica, Strain CCMP716" /LENGTH=50 /DNA_ID=CAMNT_0013456525 /DNA_START=103 /DNA_END=256 /DNA_ORIENTATION=-